MPKVIGIKFDKSPKVYYFSPCEEECPLGSEVVVETSRGVEMGTVALDVHEVAEEKITQPLAAVKRRATEDDLKKKAELKAKRDAGYGVLKEKIEKSGLEMKLVDAEYTFDGSKLVVYFTADNRVDFRNLVRELASYFHVRIELRQIGARDECRMKGGVAPCGRACCCSDHMADFAHVSIKMAKNQSLSLNPGKISGLCGRLMCCLAYENAHYVETNKKMPKVGSTATAPDGRDGTVVGVNQLKEEVRLKIENKDGFEFADYPLSDIKFVKPQPPQGKGKNGKNNNNNQSEDDEPIDADLKDLMKD